jgi:anaerobic selenocysteine-containing dehydrogenase
MYHDQFNDFVRNRVPMAYLEINPDDAKELGVSAGDVVEVYNDYGSIYAMAYPQELKRNQTFMQLAHFNGIAGDVTTPWTDRNVVPYYKGTWGYVHIGYRWATPVRTSPDRSIVIVAIGISVCGSFGRVIVGGRDMP